MVSQSFTSGKRALVGLAACLAAAAIWRACYMVANLCANAITDDYIGIVPLVAAIMSPGYNWSHFLAEATSGPHCFALPALIYAVIAQTTDWDCRTELYLGIFLSTIRSFVLACAVTSRGENVRRSLVFAILVLLTFGTSCTSVYMFGIPATASATGLLGMAIGLWTVVKMPGHIRALPIILLAGLVASSFGPFQCVATWFVYFLSSALMRVKNKFWYGGLASGAVLGVLLLKAMHVTSSGAAPTKFSAYYFVKVLNILGRGFANNIGNSVVSLPQAVYAGALGLILLAVLSYLHWRRKTALSRLAGPLALTVYGLLGAAAISLTREAIASWYCMYTTLFWSGLTAFGGLLLSTEEHKFSAKTAPLYLAASLPALFVLIAYPFTNIGYKNKDYFARDHAPSAETATRTFLTAPTYAEQVLYIPGEGNIERIMTICAPLYCMGWGAFGAHQVWALQGDYLLPAVSIFPGGENSLPVTWFKHGDYRKPAEWQDPEHLSLSLDIGSHVEWKVELPAQCKSARLLTFATYDKNGKAPKPTGERSSDLSISVYDDSKAAAALPVLLESHRAEASVDIDLSKYQGRKLLIKFEGARDAAGQPCRFEYPRLEIETTPIRRPLAEIANLKMRPGNTDLSDWFPKYTKDDLVFALTDQKLWRRENIDILSPIDPTQMHLSGKGLGALTLAPSVSINENDYSHFAFDLAVPPQIKPRVFCLQIIINGGELRNVLVPLLADGDMHKYSYDLKLLNLDPSKQQITALKLLPIYQAKDGDIKLTELRFIKRRSK